MDLDKFREQIERYLEQAEYINVLIKKEEVEKDETERYLALLAILGEKREFADKFYERMTISFEGYDRDLFSNSALSAFIKRFSASCHYLFFFLDKQTETIKNLAIIACGTGVSDGDNHAMDKEIFDTFLKRQLQGMVLLAARHDIEPARLEEAVQHVYDYFGF